MILVTATDTIPAQARVDALVVFAHTQDKHARLLDGHRLPSASVEHIHSVLDAMGATGAVGETITVSGAPKVEVGLVLVAGLGATQDGPPAAEAWRRAAGNAVRALCRQRDIAIVTPVPGAAVVGALAQGAALGSYRFTDHLSEAVRVKRTQSTAALESVVVLTTKDDAAQPSTHSALARAQVLTQAQNWARDLVNTAPNVLYPQTFADAVVEVMDQLPVDVQVLDEEGLVAGGFGGILGVGQGSAHGPRLVICDYQPADAKARVALVGKGITFDSGGLCLKPAGSMITMKCDMAGAAAVAATVLAVARLELPVAVSAYLALAENMPSSSAQRPGDVVTMRDGTTVEMINTDAEGRMVLADAIALASETGPDAIIDVATLTGAAMVALGARTAAIMSNEDDVQAGLTAAAAAAGESVWPMPIAEEIRKGMDSDVADLKHTGDKYGGAMVAAAFLREFVGTAPERDESAQTPPRRRLSLRRKPAAEQTVVADARIPWGHIDVAGPAFHESAAYGYTLKGGTGFGVRTLVTYVEDLS